MTKLNFDISITSPSELASHIVDIWDDVAIAICEQMLVDGEITQEDLDRIKNRSEDDKIVHSIASQIDALSGMNVQLAFELLNEVARKLAELRVTRQGGNSAIVGSSESFGVVELNESNIGDFAKMIGEAVARGDSRVSFEDKNLPIDAAREALTNANEMRAKVGHPPVEVPSLTGTVH